MTADSTSTSLLLRLRQPAPAASWERFVQLYTPLLRPWARRRLGRDDDAADDLVQEVFAVLVQRLPTFEYAPAKSFRAWLWTVMRSKWIDGQRRAKNAPPLVPAVLDQVPDEAEALGE